MKTISTLLISFFALVASANAGNIEITSINTTLNAVAENTVVLNWNAAIENNAVRFEVERAFYGNSFSTIATVEVAFINNNNFRINDNSAELAGRQIASYRVKKISANGTISYSNTMVVTLSNVNAAPVKSATAVRFNAANNANATITVKTITGQVAASFNNFITKGGNSISIETATLAKGIYTADVTVNGVITASQKIVVE